MTRFFGLLQTLSLVFFSREWVTTRHHVRITSFHVFKWSFRKHCSICFLLLLFYSNRIILLLLLFMSKFINSLEGKFCIKLRSINLLWKPSSCSRSKLVTTAGSWNKIDCWIIDQNSIRPTLPNVRIRSCCYYYYSKFEMGLLKGTVAALVCLHYCVCIENLLLLSKCDVKWKFLSTTDLLATDECKTVSCVYWLWPAHCTLVQCVTVLGVAPRAPTRHVTQQWRVLSVERFVVLDKLPENTSDKQVAELIPEAIEIINLDCFDESKG